MTNSPRPPHSISDKHLKENMADEGNVSEMFDVLKMNMNMMMGKIDLISTDLAKLKGQIEVMNGNWNRFPKTPTEK